MQGVGGRQQDAPTSLGGGGYPDICTESMDGFGAVGADPRIGDLLEMGLSPLWVHMASCIGYDDFLTVWRLLSEAAPRAPRGLYIPAFEQLLRFERNRLIRTLGKDGKSVKDIQTFIKTVLRETVSERHIYRVVKNYAANN